MTAVFSSVTIGVVLGWTIAVHQGKGRAEPGSFLHGGNDPPAFSLPRSHGVESLEDCPINITDSLDSLASIYQPTKFGWRQGKMKYFHTGFQRFYPLWMEEYRRKKFKMLEIGLDTGMGSLLWKAYFPCAELWGLEYAASKAATAGASVINTVQGDQGDRDFLRTGFLEKSGGNFDMIVDDGGHHFEQQTASYEVLFDLALKPGGLYVIEDVETSYHAKNMALYGSPVTRGGCSGQETVVNKFKQVADVINKKFFDKAFTVFGDVDHWIQQTTFAQNLIVLRKKSSVDCAYEADYIMAHKLSDDCPAKTQKRMSNPFERYCDTLRLDSEGR